MIPDLPKGVSEKDQLEFYATLSGNLSDQSSVHVNWHTHRRNPSVCWICDLNILTTKLIDVIDMIISKSSLDIETRLSSEKESEPEIEIESSTCVDDRYDESPNEPEFEVEDDEDVC